MANDDSWLGTYPYRLWHSLFPYIHLTWHLWLRHVQTGSAVCCDSLINVRLAGRWVRSRSLTSCDDLHISKGLTYLAQYVWSFPSRNDIMDSQYSWRAIDVTSGNRIPRVLWTALTTPWDTVWQTVWCQIPVHQMCLFTHVSFPCEVSLPCTGWLLSLGWFGFQFIGHVVWLVVLYGSRGFGCALVAPVKDGHYAGRDPSRVLRFVVLLWGWLAVPFWVVLGLRVGSLRCCWMHEYFKFGFNFSLAYIFWLSLPLIF